ncbi:hypothetical protein E1A91_A01G139900v1 [Gossypium mustelinum]|uniref:Uncharacterized protein n=3 Tax=Gossypium TaxID=3633 RepID=A0A5D3AF69_GOSMU|nr:hypothetical protein E1A91_A01G139900v1 [Gossypium mustelinum]
MRIYFFYKSSTSNLKIEELIFTRLVLASHSPSIFHPYIKYFQQLRTMVLRSYFDWQTDVPMNERKTVEAESETQLAAADGLECYWNAFELPYTFPASYLDPQNYTSLLPLYSIPPEVIPYETLSSYPCPKCQKLIEDHYCSDLMPGVFDGVAVSPCPVLEDHQVNLERMKTMGNCNKIREEKCNQKILIYSMITSC